MRITQSNRDGDTATFNQTDPPLVRGGQGRTAASLTDTVTVCGWLMLTVLQVGAVVAGLLVIDAVAGHLLAAVAALCCVVTGCLCYGAGRAA